MKVTQLTTRRSHEVSFKAPVALSRLQAKLERSDPHNPFSLVSTVRGAEFSMGHTVFRGIDNEVLQGVFDKAGLKADAAKVQLVQLNLHPPLHPIGDLLLAVGQRSGAQDLLVIDDQNRLLCVLRDLPKPGEYELATLEGRSFPFQSA